MITVALVDDDPMVRTGLNFILKGEDGIDVAWQAGDGAEALTKLRDRPVDVVLLDVRTSTSSSASRTTYSRARLPPLSSSAKTRIRLTLA